MQLVRTFQKQNLLLVLFVVTTVALLLMARIWYLMVPGAERLANAAKDLHERERVIKAERGKIYDRNAKRHAGGRRRLYHLWLQLSLFQNGVGHHRADDPALCPLYRHLRSAQFVGADPRTEA